MRGSIKVGTWGPNYPYRTEKHIAVDFLRNTCVDILENHKATDVRSSLDS